MLEASVAGGVLAASSQPPAVWLSRPPTTQTEQLVHITMPGE